MCGIDPARRRRTEIRHAAVRAMALLILLDRFQGGQCTGRSLNDGLTKHILCFAWRGIKKESEVVFGCQKIISQTCVSVLSVVWNMDHRTRVHHEHSRLYRDIISPDHACAIHPKYGLRDRAYKPTAGRSPQCTERRGAALHHNANGT